jgi:hypothetical protein
MILFFIYTGHSSHLSLYAPNNNRGGIACWQHNLMMKNKKELSWEVLSKNILSQAEPNKSSSVFYVGLYKESETGLLYNERMLVL